MSDSFNPERPFENPPAPAPAAPAPTPASSSPPAPPAPVPTIPVPAAPAGTPGPRTWKVPLTVDGQAIEEEVSEEAFTNPDSEAAKKLRASLQKARDYDRPGGAMDQQATRKAEEMARQREERNLASLVAEGVLERLPDGSYGYTQDYIAFRQRQSAPAAPPAGVPAQADPRLARLEELRAKATEGDRDAYIEWADLNAELKAEAAAQKAVQAERAARQSERDQEARQRTAQDHERALDAAISGALDAHKSVWVEPLTGTTLPPEALKPLRDAAGYIGAGAYQASKGDINTALKAARDHIFTMSAMRAAEIQRIRAAMPKAPTPAPAAAPQFGGSTPPAASREIPFDPKKPFDGFDQWKAANGRS